MHETPLHPAPVENSLQNVWPPFFPRVIPTYQGLDNKRTLENHLYHKVKTIYITGHSLGGALATILTYRLAADYPQHSTQFKLYVYGVPPIATIGFRKKFKEPSIESFAVTVIGDIFSYEHCFVYRKLHSWYMKCHLCQNYTITYNHYFEDIYVNIHRNLINYNKYLLNTHCI